MASGQRESETGPRWRAIESVKGSRIVDDADRGHLREWRTYCSRAQDPDSLAGREMLYMFSWAVLELEEIFGTTELEVGSSPNEVGRR
jgi:hypothetical protein